MSEALTKQISEADKLRLALLIITAPEPTEGEEVKSIDATLETAASRLQLSLAQIAEVMNDKTFLKLLKGFSKARASLAIHGPVIMRLVDMAVNANNREALQAARTLMQYTGELKELVQVEVKHTFDSLRKEWGSQEETDPLSQIFKIRGVDAVIDAEEIGENGND